MDIGMNLLSISMAESSAVSTNPQFGNASFARQLYIHALTYLLRGLPSDLTPEEQLSIHSALPLAIPLHSSASGSPAPPEPSLLHRTLASIIVQLFVFIQFLLPYIRWLVSTAYEYEREHKIGERVWREGMEKGKSGVETAATLLAMGDGRVGKAAMWVVEGVTGGVHEGLGEGMAVLGRGTELDVSL
jgi:hypothetical protein